MRERFLILFVLCCFISGCAHFVKTHAGNYWERTDGEAFDSEQFYQEFKDCFYPCYYSGHWRSLNRSWIPIYGGIYRLTVEKEEDKATDECFNKCIKEKGYKRKNQ